MSTTVTSKGQVTIPKRVREHLGISAGSRVEFSLAQDGNIVLTREDGSYRANRFEQMRGHAGPGLSTDELMKLLRGED